MELPCAQDLKANIGVKSNEKEQRKEAKQPGEAGAAASLSPDKKEEDDYVAGGYLKPGDSDFDFIEHPLEKRANKARENDCKVGILKDLATARVLVYCIARVFQARKDSLVVSCFVGTNRSTG